MAEPSADSFREFIVSELRNGMAPAALTNQTFVEAAALEGVAIPEEIPFLKARAMEAAPNPENATPQPCAVPTHAKYRALFSSDNKENSNG